MSLRVKFDCECDVVFNMHVVNMFVNMAICGKHVCKYGNMW